MTAAHPINYVPVTYRDYREDDEGFLYNSWLRSFRDGSKWAEEIPGQIYFANHKQVIARLLQDSGIVIAANPESDDQIFGYGVYQPMSGGVTVLHYLYVKQPYRRLGIGTALTRVIKQLSAHDPELPMVASHVSGMWDRLRVKWNLVYNPYVIGAKL